MRYILPLIALLVTFSAQAENTKPVENDVITQKEIATESKVIDNQQENKTAAEDTSKQEDKTIPEQEQEKYNVFTPEFMNNLLICKPDVAENTQDASASSARIVGKEKDECHLQYADFDLYVPFDILPNIHGFDDLNILLRNQEISRYNYQPQYLYTGLLHALNACNRGTSYLGAQKTIEIGNKRITKALEAEVSDDVCTVYLVSEFEVEDSLRDYTVTCRIGTAAIGGLLNYYRELLNKYGEKKVMKNGRAQVVSEQENDETRKADAELMFFLQQKGYCRRPNEI